MNLTRLFEIAGVHDMQKAKNLVENMQPVNRDQLIQTLFANISDWETDALSSLIEHLVGFLSDDQLQQLIADNDFS